MQKATGQGCPAKTFFVVKNNHMDVSTFFWMPVVKKLCDQKIYPHKTKHKSDLKNQDAR